MTATTAPVSRTSATAGQRRKLRLLGLLAMLIGLFAPAVALAEPAAAAGTQATQISFCGPSANANVMLNQWNGSKWVAYKAGKTNASGCGTYRYVDPGYFYAVSQVISYNSGNCHTSYTLTYWTNYAKSVANKNVSVGNLQYTGGSYWC